MHGRYALGVDDFDEDRLVAHLRQLSELKTLVQASGMDPQPAFVSVRVAQRIVLWRNRVNGGRETVPCSGEV